MQGKIVHKGWKEPKHLYLWLLHMPTLVLQAYNLGPGYLTDRLSQYLPSPPEQNRAEQEGRVFCRTNYQASTFVGT